MIKKDCKRMFITDSNIYAMALLLIHGSILCRNLISSLSIIFIVYCRLIYLRQRFIRMWLQSMHIILVGNNNVSNKFFVNNFLISNEWQLKSFKCYLESLPWQRVSKLLTFDVVGLTWIFINKIIKLLL